MSGNDTVLVVGLGRVGLASPMHARAMGASRLFGVDVVAERVELAQKLGLADEVFVSREETLQEIRQRTAGAGCERTIDSSGNTHGRQLAIRSTRKWGRCVFIGEGGTVEFNPSPGIIHDRIAIHGSWVTSIWKMEDLAKRLVRWNIHPEDLVTHRLFLTRS